MLDKLLSPFKTIDRLFGEMPFISVVYVAMTLMVVHVPFYMIFFVDGMYENEPHSSPFIPGLPIIGNLLLVAHIAAAVPAIIFGPFLFIKRWRDSRPALHRRIGTWYVIGCLISAVLVIPLAVNNTPGLIEPKIGFTVMAVIWFTVTWLAFMAAVNKDFVAHRRWIMRSYAMTFAFVHVNFTFHLSGIYLLYNDLVFVKIMQSMASWMSNLLLVEIYLAGTTHTGKFLGFKKWFKNLTQWSKFDKFYWFLK